MVFERGNRPETRSTQQMLPLEHPDRIQIAFDDHRLVNNAGLLLPATLAQHVGLRELVDRHLDLGDAPGRANAGDKMLTLVASALAGGDCIDDADALRAGRTSSVLGCIVKAPSTLGTFLRSFRWGHVRQLDRVSRELLARAWQAGAGPGDGPLTIDLDSTICETYGPAKEGARHHGYTGKRGYHPLLAVAAGTGDVLMARLREGRANTARGAAHFLRETVGRVRHAGAKGQLTVRADSGFYTHGMVSVCRKTAEPAIRIPPSRHGSLGAGEVPRYDCRRSYRLPEGARRATGGAGPQQYLGPRVRRAPVAAVIPVSPTVTSVGVATNLAPVRLDQPIPVTVTFSKPMTGFTFDDLDVTNGTAGNFAGEDGDAVYAFDVTPVSVAEVTVAIAAGAAMDGDGNGNEAFPAFLGHPLRR